ncbi:unnamed protein product [Rotaria sordida]|uniref:Dextranase n=1 Tax=Rotaria sordida TaxID=392033 RepID=A0A814G583_9BILA|nr:unnamed protein product [Rotaria sordida]
MSIPRGGREKWGYDDSDGAEFAIPYRATGYRFSVEFKTKLFTTYNLNNSPSENANGRAIHTEPRDALLIFAESILVGNDVDKYIPNANKYDIYYVSPGRVNNLNSISQTVIYFKPGIYYMPWDYHARLSTNVHWLYLAPGAYVKGAFQFESTDDIKVTGFGVLSGEKYVYEADTNNNYHHAIDEQCWATCVKMLRFTSELGKQQHLHLHGITVVEPPYHSFVVYGDEQSFRMSVSFYHQVGSWYWQTDGLEIYRGSTVENTFFHSNDDVLKIYHSNVRVNNIVVWKNENGPVIQWGWSPRTINDIIVDEVDIIHNRIWWSDIKVNTCIINSAPHYADTYSINTADPNQLISGLTISNVRSEGMSPCSMRIYALSNTQSVTIKNLWIEQWNELDKYSQVSLFKAYSDRNGHKVTIGNQSWDKKGFAIENYTVGTIQIMKAANNWQDIHLGRLGFDAELWNNWDAI